LGGDKKYLTFDDLNRELPDSVVSADDNEDVLQKLDASIFRLPILRNDLIEQAAALATDDDDDDSLDEDVNSTFPGALEKTKRPCQALPARDGRRAAAHREGEGGSVIAKELNADRSRRKKAISAADRGRRTPSMASSSKPEP